MRKYNSKDLSGRSESSDEPPSQEEKRAQVLAALGGILQNNGYDISALQMQEIENLLISTERPNTDPPKRKNSPFRKLRKKLKEEPKDLHLSYVNLVDIQICQQIGRGGSSAGVYFCLVDGWACAMKQLKREYVSKMDIQCFEREMDILYQLPPHPNIVRYLFHTTIGKDLCLFMQLYSGTLREYLDRRREHNQLLSVEMICAMALEISEGLAFLHEHNVIHRDIKAGNIFVTKNEHGELTKLAIGDFDTSLRLQASGTNTDTRAPTLPVPDLFNVVSTKQQSTSAKRKLFAKTKPCSTVGTAGFMAPEVVRSKNSTPYGFKADVYSFGMLLYELITLKLPYEQLETCDIITAILEGEEVESNLQIDEEVRSQYWMLVELHKSCTSYVPEQRPPFSDICEILRSLSKIEPEFVKADYFRPITGGYHLNLDHMKIFDPPDGMTGRSSRKSDTPDPTARTRSRTLDFDASGNPHREKKRK